MKWGKDIKNGEGEMTLPERRSPLSDKDQEFAAKWKYREVLERLYEQKADGTDVEGLIEAVEDELQNWSPEDESVFQRQLKKHRGEEGGRL